MAGMEVGMIKPMKVVILCMFLIIVALSAGVVFLYLEVKDKEDNAVKSFATCVDKRFIIKPGLDDKDGIFHELSETEVNNVKNYIIKKEKITQQQGRIKLRQGEDKFIAVIDVHFPTKQEVLNYRDHQGQKPVRKARVIIVSGAQSLLEYVVWPADKPTYYESINHTGHENPIHFNLARLPTREMRKHLSASVARGAVSKLWPLYRETFEDLRRFRNPLVAVVSGFSYIAAFDYHTQISKNGDRYVGMYLTAVSGRKKSILTKYTMIYYLMNITAQNYIHWSIAKIIYNNQSFSSVKETLDAYNNKILKVVNVPSIPKEDFKREGLAKRPSRKTSNLQEPMLYAPNGPRFSIVGRKISYMDWQFEYGVRALNGPGIFDVRYRSRRIAYEISLQEFVSFYSSASPLWSSGNYFNTLWGLGRATSLVKGIDCPEHAVYFNTVHHMYDIFRPVSLNNDDVIENAVCVFEANYQVPLRRHKIPDYDGKFKYGGLTDNALVVRFIHTMKEMGSDVIYDYIFHINGVVEVKSTVTGYSPTNYNFKNIFNGYEIYNNQIGVVHDDFALFKVDIDVEGERNSFQTLRSVIAEHKDVWDSEPIKKKRLQVNKITSEKDAAVRKENSSSEYFIIYNNNSTNRFNNKRGYRVQILNSNTQIYPDDHIATLQGEWTKYKIAVTKHKESETVAGCFLNSLHPQSPAICSFDRRINDDENIENEDLVAWVSIGGLRIPSAEDFPAVTTAGNHYSFILRPFNYMDEDASMTSGNSVYIEKSIRVTDRRYNTTIITYGVPTASTCPVPERNFM